jgi:hypothetical protein
MLAKLAPHASRRMPFGSEHRAPSAVVDAMAPAYAAERWSRFLCVTDGKLRASLATKSAGSLPPGAVTEFTIPSDGSGPHSITTGPDGALWFAEYHGNRVGRLVASLIVFWPTPATASRHTSALRRCEDPARASIPRPYFSPRASTSGRVLVVWKRHSQGQKGDLADRSGIGPLYRRIKRTCWTFAAYASNGPEGDISRP